MILQFHFRSCSFFLRVKVVHTKRESKKFKLLLCSLSIIFAFGQLTVGFYRYLVEQQSQTRLVAYEQQWK